MDASNLRDDSKNGRDAYIATPGIPQRAGMQAKTMQVGMTATSGTPATATSGMSLTA
jgi:hypothetical protein